MPNGKGTAHEANIGAKITATAILRDVLSADERRLVFALLMEAFADEWESTRVAPEQVDELYTTITANWNGR